MHKIQMLLIDLHDLKTVVYVLMVLLAVISSLPWFCESYDSVTNTIRWLKFNDRQVVYRLPKKEHNIPVYPQ